MKRNTTIQIKAAVLVLVFSLNTVLGFACSLGFDMGYNTLHHHEDEIVASTSHHDHHGEEKENHHSEKSSENSKDDCCSNGVNTFNLLDKTTPHTVNLVPPVFASPYIAPHYFTYTLPELRLVKNIKAFARSHHPPIPDIRIAIQSFLI